LAPEHVARTRVEGFFHRGHSAVTYLVSDRATGCCAVIDPVLDMDIRSGRISSASADALCNTIVSRDLTLKWILETHVHADHLSAAQTLRTRFSAPVAIGEHVRDVQRSMKHLFNLPSEFLPDGRQFDRLLADGDELEIGETRLRVMHTPGHTPACVTYVGQDCAFVGDTLFMPDCGTARADFPGGSALALFASVRRILDLPPSTTLYACHDYPPAGRPATWISTVAGQRRDNIDVHDGISETDFVRRRDARDRDLELPQLLIPALQFNIRGGRVPPPEVNGVSYFKIPINVLG
jgi:glyoxylase-like metal-dependent hydrolase (beta-lactamase superfamily II)